MIFYDGRVMNSVWEKQYNSAMQCKYRESRNCDVLETFDCFYDCSDTINMAVVKQKSNRYFLLQGDDRWYKM